MLKSASISCNNKRYCLLVPGSQFQFSASIWTPLSLDVRGEGLHVNVSGCLTMAMRARGLPCLVTSAGDSQVLGTLKQLHFVFQGMLIHISHLHRQ